MLRAAVLLFLLPGCFVVARAGPSYSFDGDRDGVTAEVLVGAEWRFHPESSVSPVNRRFALFDGAGYKASNVDGAHHGGGLFEIGAAAMLTLQHDRAEPETGRATILRANASAGIGKLAGLEGSSNVGTIVRAVAVVEVQEYWAGWSVRLGAGVSTESVVVEERVPMPQKHAGTYAPIATATFEFTPLMVRLLWAVISH